MNTGLDQASTLLQCRSGMPIGLTAFPVEADSSDGYGILAVDAVGRIRACSQSMAELAGASTNELLGEPARRVLAGLPMKDETPGYNLAWAAFNAAQQAWHPYRLVAADGHSLSVEVFVTWVTAHAAQLLLLVVRRHAG